MIESSKALRILSFVFLASMLLTVAFIFVNSMLPPEISSEQSDIIGDILAEIIPPETNAGSFIQQYLMDPAKVKITADSDFLLALIRAAEKQIHENSPDKEQLEKALSALYQIISE